MGSHLPTSRIKIIMKSSAEVVAISQESLFLVTRATEHFMQYMAREAFKISKGRKLEYNDLTELVHKTERLNFLAEMLPKKITLLQYKQMLQNQSDSTGSDDSDIENS